MRMKKLVAIPKQASVSGLRESMDAIVNTLITEPNVAAIFKFLILMNTTYSRLFETTDLTEQAELEALCYSPWDYLPSEVIIAISDYFSTPHYAHKLPVLYRHTDGVRGYDDLDSEAHYKCFNGAYGAGLPGFNNQEVMRKLGMAPNRRLAVLPSNAVYTAEYARVVTLIAYLFKPLVPNDDLVNVLIQNTGSDGVGHALQGCIRYLKACGKKQPGIVLFRNFFHGREAVFNTPISPENDPYHRALAEFNDPVDLDETVARLEREGHDGIVVVVEPIQGEGGVNVASPEFINKINELRKKKGVVVCSDEVQAFGRGKVPFASNLVGLDTDTTVFSKLVTGGTVPCSFVVMGREFGRIAFGPDTAGGTYAGHPTATIAVDATLLQMFKRDVTGKRLFDKLQEKGDYIREKGESAVKENPDYLVQVKGWASMLGLEFKSKADAQHYSRLLMVMKDVLVQKGLIDELKERLIHEGIDPSHAVLTKGLPQKLSGQTGTVMRLTVMNGADEDTKAMGVIMRFILTHPQLKPGVLDLKPFARKPFRLDGNDAENAYLESLALSKN